MNAIIIDENDKFSAYDMCLALKEEEGLLTKPTHENIIRLTPPLTINEQRNRKSIVYHKKVYERLRS